MDDSYFAYGSNMNLAQMASVVPAKLGEQVHLPDWRYFINGNGYAGIESSGAGGGCLWSLLPQHWEVWIIMKGLQVDTTKKENRSDQLPKRERLPSGYTQ